jgi:hypothetical protein
MSNMPNAALLLSAKKAPQRSVGRNDGNACSRIEQRNDDGQGKTLSM